MAKRGRKPGYVSTQRKFAGTTKVARIPSHWDMNDIYGDIEAVLSKIDDVERLCEESRQRSKSGKLSNRLEALEAEVADLKGMLSSSFSLGE